VVSNALDIACLMCSYAGDFMKGRIEGMWEDLRDIQSRTVKANNTWGGKEGAKVSTLEATRGVTMPVTMSLSEVQPSRTEFYVDVPTRLIWDSMVRLLCSIAEFVSVNEEYFDDILDMLDPVLSNSNVRKAVEARNPDVVWLHLSRKDNLADHPANLDGFIPAEISLLNGKAYENFVRLHF
jgi:hypothetical protein